MNKKSKGGGTMFRPWLDKIKEAGFAIIPIVFIVLVLHFSGIASLSSSGGEGLLWPFLVSALFMVVGIILFTMGSDAAMATIGDFVGSDLTKKGNVKAIVIVAFLIGSFVTLAEPDVQFLSSMVPVNTWLFAGLVALGVGMFLAAGLLRIIFKKNLELWFILAYCVVFGLASLYVQKTDNLAYIALSFDAGGVTTGSLTVPFIIALGASVANVRGGKGARENSFGLIALCSVGPIIMILLLGLFAPANTSYVAPVPTNLAEAFVTDFKGVSISLLPIAIFFVVYNALFLKLPKKQIIKISIGILYTYLGLVIFLTCIDYGFFPVAKVIGRSIGQISLDTQTRWLIVVIGAILGAVSAVAEPAIYVLNQQVEEISGGLITRKSMMIGISIGIALSVALSMVRLVFDINIIYFLVPGYLLAIALSFVVPNIYTAVAFDSGGVASGTMTATFILPFAIGVCQSLYAGDPTHLDSIIARNAFGMVALVAMTPLVVVQLLGFTALTQERMRRKIARTRIKEAFDDQVIHFI